MDTIPYNLNMEVLMVLNYQTCVHFQNEMVNLGKGNIHTCKYLQSI